MLLLANWKMHGDRELVRRWVAAVAPAAAGKPAPRDEVGDKALKDLGLEGLFGSGTSGVSDVSPATEPGPARPGGDTAALATAVPVRVGLFPPFPLLPAAADALKAAGADHGMLLGAQHLDTEAAGARTGEVSAPMLLEAGCRAVLVGHSERRQLFGETDALVAARAAAALAAGLRPVLCLGETAEQREAGRTENVLDEQLAALAEMLRSEHPEEQRPAIAYEPVWAIGTGRSAEVADIDRAHRHIRRQLPQGVAVLYGGSVNRDNVRQILASAEVDGTLVGGASLKPEEFAAMVRIAANLARTERAPSGD